MKIKLLGATGLLILTSSTAHGASLVGLVELGAGSQALSMFDSSSPGIASGAPVTISGLGSGESLLGIDFRPATGQLFGLGSSGSLYTLNLSSGVASQVGSGFGSALSATSYGFDFNPVIDRIRIVGDDDSNTVGHPDLGTATIVTSVFYDSGDVNFGANPNVVHHAYTNSFSPAPSSTQLYAIDTALDILVAQANSAGTLTTIGSLGIDAMDLGGFDIAPDGTAYAAFSNGLVTTLYTLDLTTGSATMIGNPTGSLSGLAVVPEPTTALLCSAASLLGLRRRRA
ncbi:hypothetical protein HNR46_001925 [Haloferula luteola]|uniref:DUF4394 domain-containing protein n=1 Tax=Haloferula luteola TaxID=595692 RepID=A0A840V3R2_9BACT|nr:DUF4394 domain-containing protein [Haloferula luteola]MBB5351686.1 hypothetical protein [Haloferula luteola]